MESLDVVLLRLLKHREYHEMYSRAVPMGLIDPKAKAILKDYGSYFEETESATASGDPFRAWFRLKHPKLKPEARALFEGILRTAEEEVDDEVRAGLLIRLETARQANNVADMLSRYESGDDFDLVAALQAAVDSIPTSTYRLPLVEVDLDSMLDDEENEWGFSWRLSCMNDSMRPLRPGDFGILAARVDVGKTTWISSELSYFATQVDDLFPGEDRSIIILNNEGPGKRLNQRLIQSTLGATIPDLLTMRAAGKNPWQETLSAWGGRQVVQVFDVHDMGLSRLEDIVRRTRPAIVVADMLDVVPFDGDVVNGGQRTDQVLEAAYQRARLWAVKYDCSVLAASQLSAEAAGLPYPPQHMLANSRTGKPGAADFIAMLGHSLDPVLQNSRWVSLPKNKLALAGRPKDPQCEVQFIPDRARIIDPKELD